MAIARSAMSPKAVSQRAIPERRAEPARGHYDGALFLLSDAVLATDKFVGGIPPPTLWDLSVHRLAQWLIARAAVASLPDLRDSE
jgi:hypothetical protein